MTESRDPSPREIVAAAHRAMLAGDAEGFAAFFAEDAVLEFPSSLQPALPYRAQGREAIRRVAPSFCRRFLNARTRLPRFDAPDVQETADPDGIILSFGARPASSRASGRSPETQVWRVRDGRVLSMHDYLGAPPQERPRLEGRGPLGSAWG